VSFDVILPFLRPIEHLIRNPQVSEIMVNGSSRVFFEEGGVLKEASGARIAERSLQVAVRNIARALGDEIGEEKPILDSRLPDGSRVAAVIPPCSVGGTTLTIRKFHSRFFTVDELKRIGTVTDEIITRLKRAVERRENILISGGTGTGKTTLLNALSAFIPDTERLIVIEDTAEIQISSRNLVRFEARRAHPNLPAVTIRNLLRAALRHRPDRIILGEVRGGEAFDLLQALNTGHSGTLSTIHANSADQAISRMITCVLQSGVEIPYDAIKSAIADSISLLLHVERWKTYRFVSQLVEIQGYEHTNRQYQLETVYQRHPRRS
jgi:pilus assembly protein CpaF